MAGIVSFGAYVPRYRLKRMTIFGAMGWINPANIMLAQGEKAVANQDEDSLTMATEAVHRLFERFRPVQDRWPLLCFHYHALPGEAEFGNHFHGPEPAAKTVRSADFSGALKSGTSALLSALEGVGSGSCDRSWSAPPIAGWERWAAPRR